KEKLQKHNHNIVTANIKTIETIGGGSARCMIAEIFHQ
ncbi:MAG: arginine deiminase-related protein, partial [Ignavibacteria bacterium]